MGCSSLELSPDDMLDVLHFEEAGRTNPVEPGTYMPTPVYGQALDFLVFACVDLVFTYQHQLLLAKRNTYPRSSWWIIGGRMVAGEDPRDTARRKAHQEAQLANLDAARLRCIGVFSTCFARRQQPPQHHGSHSLNVTYQIELTLAEKDQVSLRPDEYDTWQWVDVDRVKGQLKPDDAMDQALLAIVANLQLAGVTS